MTSTTSYNALRAPQQAARISGTHGYRIDGDTAHLNAEIEWTPSADARASWTLQLWAHPTAFERNGSAIKVAELPLRASSEASAEHVAGSGVALPPAGSTPYTMVMALAQDGFAGSAVHDQVTFAWDEQFVQPRLQGAEWRFDDDGGVLLQAGRVSNPRDLDNLSGSLVIELWALPAAYEGGAFEGVRVASAALGRLGGQNDWSGIGILAPIEQQPAVAAHYSLMLREWTAAGYVTRDFANVDARPLAETTHAAPVEAEAPAAKSDEAAVAKVEAAPAATTEAAAPAKVDAAVPAKAEAAAPAKAAVTAPAKPAAAAETPSTAAQPVRTTWVAGATPSVVEPAAAGAKAKASAPAPAKASAAKQPAAKAAGKPAAAPTVSINRASEAELAELKGMPKAVAKAIVAGRPYTSLDGLTKVKGMGAKLLEKLRPLLGL